MKKKTIPNYLQIFEKKLEDIKGSIKKEVTKPKKERSKAKLKTLLQSAKQLKRTIKEVREDHKAKCPHCGKEI